MAGPVGAAQAPISETEAAEAPAKKKAEGAAAKKEAEEAAAKPRRKLRLQRLLLQLLKNTEMPRRSKTSCQRDIN